MKFNRRGFLKSTGNAAAMAAALPATFNTPYLWKSSNPSELLEDQSRADLINDPEMVRRMALIALDATKAAGAKYADVRITRIVDGGCSPGSYSDEEYLGIAVRALVEGAWGFASSSYWAEDEAVRLGTHAVTQAKINAAISPRDIDVGVNPPITGSWSTPVDIDPFSIPIEEKQDFIESTYSLIPRRYRPEHIRYSWNSTPILYFSRTEETIATSEGAFYSQVFKNIGGIFVFKVEDLNLKVATGYTVDGLYKSSGGWERVLNADIPGQVVNFIEKGKEVAKTPRKPAEIGRYDIVCDGATMASIIAASLGTATQLDRCLGYEANAEGTSYLGPDPMDQLGQSVGSPLLTVSGNRSMSVGLATVKWDAEGVEPHEFDIVSQGKLVDFQTNREQSKWLDEWYSRNNFARRSHGCARGSILGIPMQRTPNLVMKAGQEQLSFDDMVSSVKKGLALVAGRTSTDYQSRTGIIEGEFREIINGKLGDFVDGGGIMFDSKEIWKTLTDVGGSGTESVRPFDEMKGQPAQASSYSVQAVPGIFKEAAVIIPWKR